MRYKVGDIVKLNRDYVVPGKTTIKKGSQGVVTSVKELLQQYIVDFMELSNVWLADDDLE
jgi:hypothetical protein